jgi:tartrate-resistant acid phosphatase type 5
MFLAALLAVRIAVVGDVGSGTEAIARGLARLHRQSPIEAIITTGDNIYPCGVKSLKDPRWRVLAPLSGLGIPIHPVLGNHDYCGDPDLEVGAPLANWDFPAREYLFHTALADFAMLDTNRYASGRAPPPDVGALLNGSTTRWRIAVGHHPLLSSGYHGRLPRAEHHRMVALIPAMRHARVDLYICGHDHHLELIDGQPRMLISGAGSDPVPPLLRHANTIWANEGPPYRGFAILEIAPDSLSIQFYDAAGDARSRAFVMKR